VADAALSEVVIYPAGVPSATPLAAPTVPPKPHGIVVDASGNVYVASSESGTVEVYSSGNGTLTLLHTLSEQLVNPQGLAFDPSGDLFVANPKAKRIVEFGP
jgi:DNA-binding beta-propeller fold protein YncE